MRSRKLYSVGVVSVLVVLASVAGVAFTAGPGANADVSSTSNADTGGIPAQEGEALQTDETEPNDDRANATAIPTNGSYVAGNVEDYNGTTDVDFHEFHADAGQAINVYLGGGISGTRTVVYDPSGDVIASEVNGNDPTTIGGVADESGTYYLKTSVNDSAGPVSYRLAVGLADADASEPNDDLGEATPVKSGEHADGTVAKGDTDIFAVETDAGDTITADGALRDTKIVNQGNIAIDILNADGERLNEVANDTDYPFKGDNVTNQDGVNGADGVSEQSVNATVEDAGTYYVRVEESPWDNDFTDIGGFVSYGLDVGTTGGDETAETPAIEPLDRPNATRIQNNASITFDDQTTDGSSVTVSQVTFENGSVGGVVGIYNEEDIPIGTTLVDSGTTENISIDIEQRSLIDDDTIGAPEGDLAENTTLTARLIDLDERQFVNRDGSLVADSANITVAEPETDDSASSTTYYQVDFVSGHQIQNLGGPKGTYTTDELIRFAHGSSEQPITRRSAGEFTTDETLADRIDSRNITVENGTATTTFTVSEGEPVTLTLASYTKPGAKWSRETEHLQEFIDGETRTFDAGTHTLTVELPDEGNESNQTGGDFSLDGFRADAEGPDEGVNLFDENFAFENTGDGSIDLSGYTVEYSSGLQYRFNDGPTVAPGERVVVVTGPGTDTVNEPNSPDDVRTYLEYGNFGEEALKNDGGTVTITDTDGEVVFNASYGTEA